MCLREKIEKKSKIDVFMLFECKIDLCYNVSNYHVFSRKNRKNVENRCTNVVPMLN